MQHWPWAVKNDTKMMFNFCCYHNLTRFWLYIAISDVSWQPLWASTEWRQQWYIINGWWWQYSTKDYAPWKTQYPYIIPQSYSAINEARHHQPYLEAQETIAITLCTDAASWSRCWFTTSVIMTRILGRIIIMLRISPCDEFWIILQYYCTIGLKYCQFFIA